jgi:enamine deaminase RidA (YjgF/YER057c/UK114 family)
MLTRHIPDSIAPPFSNYAHGVEAPGAARWLYISGQVGVRPDGAMAEGAEAQMEQAWRNLLAILADADMGPENLVKVTSLLTRREDIVLSRQVRERMLGGVQTAATLAIVAGLAHPDWLVEIEAVAAA